MSNFTKWSFANRSAVALVTVLIVVLSALSVFRIPMELFPAADQPSVVVVSYAGGIDAKTMETEVTNPMEQVLGNISGKKGITSTTGDSFTQIVMNFESGSDMKQAKSDVQEALATLALPAYTSKPNVIQLNTSMIPVSQIAITFDKTITSENLQLVNKTIVPALEDVEGVSRVDAATEGEAVVTITFDQTQLAARQIPIPVVLQSLQLSNTASVLSERQIDGKNSTVKLLSNLSSIEELERRTVAPNTKLSDIAEVKVEKKGQLISHFNGREGILLAVIKESSANSVGISKAVDEKITELNKEYPKQEGVVFWTAGENIENSVYAMATEVLLGALFATIIILVFLRNLQSTFIAIISIPLSLGITVILLSWSGITLNIFTLGGVAVAIGRLVDDSIIVIENIYKKLQKQQLTPTLVIDATKEMSAAIVASTLTTVAVFLPISFVDASLKQFILPFALTVTYSLLASLLVSLTLVPLLSYTMLKRAKPHHDSLAQPTQKIVRWSLQRKGIILALSVLLFIGSIAGYIVMPKGAMNNSSNEFISATVEFSVDTPFSKIKSYSEDFDQAVRKIENVKHTIVKAGTTESDMKFGNITPANTFMVWIVPTDTKYVDSIYNDIEKLKKDTYGNAVLKLLKASFMGASGTTISVDVIGDDIQQLQTVAATITKKIKAIEGVERVTSNHEVKKTRYTYELDASKANFTEIQQQLYLLMNPMPVGSIQDGNVKRQVVVSPLANPKSEADLGNLPVSVNGQIVPMSAVATLKKELTETTFYHKDGEMYYHIEAFVKPDELSSRTADINAVLFGNDDVKGIDVPDNVTVVMGGASAQQASDFSSLFTVMLVSIGIVFLIMVIQFKSIRTPVAIMVTLPLASIGSILALMISGLPIDVTSLLGALMLIGIVVTNAIVLIDRVKQNEETMSVREALIEASGSRIRPILMTALATIFAMTPLLFKQAEGGSLVSQNLAIIVIGGLFLSTLLTTVVIPCVYELFYFRRVKMEREISQ